MAVDPACLDAGVEFGAIGEGEVVASICGFSLALPDIPIPPIKVTLPPIDLLLPKLPFPKLNFVLSCSPDKPIDITAGLEFGGGRVPCVISSDDDEEDVGEAA